MGVGNLHEKKTKTGNFYVHNISFICLKKTVVLPNRSEEHHIKSQDRKQAYMQNKMKIKSIFVFTSLVNIKPNR